MLALELSSQRHTCTCTHDLWSWSTPKLRWDNSRANHCVHDAPTVPCKGGGREHESCQRPCASTLELLDTKRGKGGRLACVCGGSVTGAGPVGDPAQPSGVGGRGRPEGWPRRRWKA
eukprot:scaffold158571_cov31-Tisochrysis_lutea.AAC.2